MTILTNPISRRRALLGAAGVAGAATLGACTTDGGPAGGGGNGSPAADGVNYPNYIPYQAIEPQIAAHSEYGYGGYLEFPSDPVSAVDSKPLDGETVTTAAALQAPAPAPMDRNPWWQHIGEILGGTIEMDFAPAAEYPAKLSTMMAGGALPDLVQIPNGLANRAAALQGNFHELSEHIGGDKIAPYSQLANLTEAAWRGATFNGGIYGVPMPLGFVSSRIISREDLIKEQGLTSDVSNADEYFELCESVSDTGQNRWALGSAVLSSYVREMFNVPNVWRPDASGWVADHETDEWIEALEFTKKLWDAGAIHPDAFGTVNVVDEYKAGRVIMMSAGGAGMVSTYNLYVDAAPGLEMGMPVAPKADGSGQARKTLGTGIYTLTAIPNNVDKERVPQLLDVLNTLGAGFGTTEYLAVQFGMEGETWERDADTGAPLALPSASGFKLPFNYLPGNMAGGYYSAGYPEIVETAMDYEKQIFTEEPVLNPTTGLVSDTQAKSGAELTAFLTDQWSGVVQGRRPVSEWPDVAQEWRDRGGDTIREELQAASEAQ